MSTRGTWSWQTCHGFSSMCDKGMAAIHVWDVEDFQCLCKFCWKSFLDLEFSAKQSCSVKAFRAWAKDNPFDGAREGAPVSSSQFLWCCLVHTFSGFSLRRVPLSFSSWGVESWNASSIFRAAFQREKVGEQRMRLETQLLRLTEQVWGNNFTKAA